MLGTSSQQRSDRADAREHFRRLFPHPLRVVESGFGDRRPREDAQQYVALPSVEHARVIVPNDRVLAARAFRRARHPMGLRAQVETTAIEYLLWLGAGRALTSHLTVTAPHGGESIVDILGELLGEPVRIAIFLGPPRANRKPVLQVIDVNGLLLGIAKIGVNALTCRLTKTEAAALRSISSSPLRSVRVPRLLAERAWGNAHVIVQSPLPVWEQSRTDDVALRFDAFKEIARCREVGREAVGDSEYMSKLRRRVDVMPDSDAGGHALKVLDRLSGRASEVVEFGSWHGDLTAWNMATAGNQALVWDWERFESGVPVGYDALHYAFLPSLKRDGASRQDAGLVLLERAHELLAPFSVEVRKAETVAMLYLIEIACRFSLDGQAETGVAGGEVGRWLTPALGRFLAASGA